MKTEFKTLLESAKYAPLSDSQENTLAAIMETTAAVTEDAINEGTIASDIAQFTPFLMPMLRRIYPALIANELLGVQPLNSPTGFIYSLSNRYIGSAKNGLTGKPGDNYTPGGPAQFKKTNAATQIIVLNKAATVGQGVKLATGVLGAYAAGDARIVYIEPTNHGALGSNWPTGQTVPNSLGGADVDGAAGGQKGGLFAVLVELPEQMFFGGKVNGVAIKGDVVATYQGPSAFDKILPNFSGSYTTANGETRGVVGNEMNEVGIAIERTQIEAKTRKLRAEYTLEMYQDLKAMHGVLADQELMNLMSYEIKAETDREVVDFVNSRAALEQDFYLNGAGKTNPAVTDFNAGRWEIERYRALGIKISDISRQIGRLNKAGSANKLLVSPKIVTVLEAIGSFVTASQDSSVNANNLNPVAGRFDNKFNVIVDNYADNGEYVTALYKGSNQDSLGVYAPYAPVSIQKVTHVTTGQPALIAMTRYGIAENPFGGQNYATTMGVKFDNTILV